jgi:hypothetical protein
MQKICQLSRPEFSNPLPILVNLRTVKHIAILYQGKSKELATTVRNRISVVQEWTLHFKSGHKLPERSIWHTFCFRAVYVRIIRLNM